MYALRANEHNDDDDDEDDYDDIDDDDDDEGGVREGLCVCTQSRQR